MLLTHLKNVAAMLIVLAIMLVPSMASAYGLNTSLSQPNEGRTITASVVWAPDAGIGFMVRYSKDNAAIHGGAWFGDKTNGVLGIGVTADYDPGPDFEVNGEIGYSVVFKKREDFARNAVPYFRLGAAYLDDDRRYEVGGSYYGFALNEGLDGQPTIDFGYGKEGKKDDAPVTAGMTEVDPPEEECIPDYEIHIHCID